jgi:ribosomal protein S19
MLFNRIEKLYKNNKGGVTMKKKVKAVSIVLMFSVMVCMLPGCGKTNKTTGANGQGMVGNTYTTWLPIVKEKENPQLIFESLNSTGLDLTQADLIRNYLLMGQSYRVQTELYNNYWLKIEKILPDTTISDFIRDYLTLKTLVIPNKDKVYQAFKDYYVTLTNYDAEGFLDELKTYAEYYSWFKYCNSPNIETNNKLSQLQRLKSTVVYPFLLNIFEDCYLYNRIDINEVNSTLTVIISYVLRRLICDLPTNALNKVFASLTKDIHKYDKYDLKDKVSIVLINKKGKTSFPNNIFFKEKILIKDCYNFPYIKYILEEIEKNSSREVVDFENLTIEHIMPQTLSAQWKVYLGKKYNDIHIKSLHKLGNLTLTAYNSDMSNSIFMDKKEIYKNSNLKMNRDIYNQYKEWGEVEIDSRSEKLFNELIGIWKYPDIQISDENVINTKTEFDITDDIDVTGKSPIELEICGGKYNVDCWRGFFKCVCQQMYEYDSQIFTSLIRHKDFQGRTRRIISDNPDELRESAKIADEIYIEQNLSANDALNYSKLVIEMYNDMENEVTYKIR